MVGKLRATVSLGKVVEKQLVAVSGMSCLLVSPAAVFSVSCDEGDADCVQDQGGHDWVQPNTPWGVVEEEGCEGDNCKAQRQAEREPFDVSRVRPGKEGLNRGVSGEEGDEQCSQRISDGNKCISWGEKVDCSECGDGTAQNEIQPAVPILNRGVLGVACGFRGLIGGYVYEVYLASFAKLSEDFGYLLDFFR